MNSQLKDAASHFQFGENWQDFASKLSDRQVELAIESLRMLLPDYMVAGRGVLEIGSGSGLSTVAALRLGAARVTAIDIDPRSVAATREVVQQFGSPERVQVEQKSVFDLLAEEGGRFDIVHSWGVLHHTGNLDEALETAARLVAPGGLLALSLYRRTAIDRFWIWEKRVYTQGSAGLRAAIRAAFKVAYLCGILLTGRNPVIYVREYSRKRGMSWSHDIHDWLGGFPYEAIDSAELIARMRGFGFANELTIERPVAVLGLFGAPCNEYRFRRC